MKNLKMFFLVMVAIILLATSESFSYPRHRIYRAYRFPVYNTGVVRTYYVVKKTKLHHKHHKKIIRRIIYY
jgi:hypothetical protein